MSEILYLKATPLRNSVSTFWLIWLQPLRWYREKTLIYFWKVLEKFVREHWIKSGLRRFSSVTVTKCCPSNFTKSNTFPQTNTACKYNMVILLFCYCNSVVLELHCCTTWFSINPSGNNVREILNHLIFDKKYTLSNRYQSYPWPKNLKMMLTKRKKKCAIAWTAQYFRSISYWQFPSSSGKILVLLFKGSNIIWFHFEFKNEDFDGKCISWCDPKTARNLA